MEDAKLIYSEVLGVLLALGNTYMEKTPSHIVNFLRKNCDYSRIPDIDSSTRLENQNISEDSKTFIMLLKYTYWCESDAERTEMYKLMKNNEIKKQKELEEKYNIDNIFKSNNVEDKEQEKNTALVKPVKNKLLDKIKCFLKRIFRKKD